MTRRALLWVVGVVIILGTSLGWFVVKKKRFPGFPGTYLCKDFGLPDRSNSYLYISADGTVETSHTADGNKNAVGKITIETRKRALFELNEWSLQMASLMLDPSAIHYFNAKGRHLKVVGTKDGNEVYNYECKRQ